MWKTGELSGIIMFAKGIIMLEASSKRVAAKPSCLYLARAFDSDNVDASRQFLDSIKETKSHPENSSVCLILAC